MDLRSSKRTRHSKDFDRYENDRDYKPPYNYKRASGELRKTVKPEILVRIPKRKLGNLNRLWDPTYDVEEESNKQEKTKNLERVVSDIRSKYFNDNSKLYPLVLTQRLKLTKEAKRQSEEEKRVRTSELSDGGSSESDSDQVHSHTESKNQDIREMTTETDDKPSDKPLHFKKEIIRQHSAPVEPCTSSITEDTGIVHTSSERIKTQADTTSSLLPTSTTSDIPDAGNDINENAGEDNIHQLVIEEDPNMISSNLVSEKVMPRIEKVDGQRNVEAPTTSNYQLLKQMVNNQQQSIGKHNLPTAMIHQPASRVAVPLKSTVPKSYLKPNVLTDDVLRQRNVDTFSVNALKDKKYPNIFVPQQQPNQIQPARIPINNTPSTTTSSSNRYSKMLKPDTMLSLGNVNEEQLPHYKKNVTAPKANAKRTGRQASQKAHGYGQSILNNKQAQQNMCNERFSDLYNIKIVPNPENTENGPHVVHHMTNKDCINPLLGQNRPGRINYRRASEQRQPPPYPQYIYHPQASNVPLTLNTPTVQRVLQRQSELQKQNLVNYPNTYVYTSNKAPPQHIGMKYIPDMGNISEDLSQASRNQQKQIVQNIYNPSDNYYSHNNIPGIRNSDGTILNQTPSNNPDVLHLPPQHQQELLQQCNNSDIIPFQTQQIHPLLQQYNNFELNPNQTQQKNALLNQILNSITSEYSSNEPDTILSRINKYLSNLQQPSKLDQNELLYSYLKLFVQHTELKNKSNFEIPSDSSKSSPIAKPDSSSTPNTDEINKHLIKTQTSSNDSAQYRPPVSPPAVPEITSNNEIKKSSTSSSTQSSPVVTPQTITDTHNNELKKTTITSSNGNDSHIVVEVPRHSDTLHNNEIIKTQINGNSGAQSNLFVIVPRVADAHQSNEVTKGQYSNSNDAVQSSIRVAATSISDTLHNNEMIKIRTTGKNPTEFSLVVTTPTGSDTQKGKEVMISQNTSMNLTNSSLALTRNSETLPKRSSSVRDNTEIEFQKLIEENEKMKMRSLYTKQQLRMHKIILNVMELYEILDFDNAFSVKETQDRIQSQLKYIRQVMSNIIKEYIEEKFLHGDEKKGARNTNHDSVDFQDLQRLLRGIEAILKRYEKLCSLDAKPGTVKVESDTKCKPNMVEDGIEIISDDDDDVQIREGAASKLKLGKDNARQNKQLPGENNQTFDINSSYSFSKYILGNMRKRHLNDTDKEAETAKKKARITQSAMSESSQVIEYEVIKPKEIQRKAITSKEIVTEIIESDISDTDSEVSGELEIKKKWSSVNNKINSIISGGSKNVSDSESNTLENAGPKTKEIFLSNSNLYKNYCNEHNAGASLGGSTSNTIQSATPETVCTQTNQVCNKNVEGRKDNSKKIVNFIDLTVPEPPLKRVKLHQSENTQNYNVHSIEYKNLQHLKKQLAPHGIFQSKSDDGTKTTKELDINSNSPKTVNARDVKIKQLEIPGIQEYFENKFEKVETDAGKINQQHIPLEQTELNMLQTLHENISEKKFVPNSDAPYRKNSEKENILNSDEENLSDNHGKIKKHEHVINSEEQNQCSKHRKIDEKENMLNSDKENRKRKKNENIINSEEQNENILNYDEQNQNSNHQTNSDKETGGNSNEDNQISKDQKNREKENRQKSYERNQNNNHHISSDKITVPHSDEQSQNNNHQKNSKKEIALDADEEQINQNSKHQKNSKIKILLNGYDQIQKMNEKETTMNLGEQYSQHHKTSKKENVLNSDEQNQNNNQQKNNVKENTLNSDEENRNNKYEKISKKENILNSDEQNKNTSNNIQSKNSLEKHYLEKDLFYEKNCINNVINDYSISRKLQSTKYPFENCKIPENKKLTNIQEEDYPNLVGNLTQQDKDYTNLVDNLTQQKWASTLNEQYHKKQEKPEKKSNLDPIHSNIQVMATDDRKNKLAKIRAFDIGGQAINIEGKSTKENMQVQNIESERLTKKLRENLERYSVQENRKIVMEKVRRKLQLQSIQQYQSEESNCSNLFSLPTGSQFSANILQGKINNNNTDKSDTSENQLKEDYLKKCCDFAVELKHLKSKDKLTVSEYINEIKTISTIKIPPIFKNFYSYVSKYQIAHSHRPISFKLFMELVNGGVMNEYFENYQNYERKKLELQEYQTECNLQNSENVPRM